MDPDHLAALLMKGEAPSTEPWHYAAAVLNIGAALVAGTGGYTVERIRRACKVLNGARQFAQTQQLALAWTGRHGFDPTVVKHQAQALINMSVLGPAEELLEQAIDIASLPGSPTQARFELPEYQGLQARVFKQRFVDSGNLDFLEASFIRYLVQFREPRRAAYWHGVNAVALLARAEREGHVMPSNLVAGEASSQSLAEEVLAQLKATSGPPDDEPWRYAAFSEIYLALNDQDKAELWLGRMMLHDHCTPFMLDSYERQLREIWQAGGTTGQPACADVLATMLSRYQMETASRLSVSPARINELRHADHTELERNFSGAGSFTVDMVKRMLGACDSIGCVCTRDGARLGTGFLIEAGSVGGPTAQGLLFVTNAHVLSNTVQGAVPLADALVSFDLMPTADGKPVYFEIGDMLFTSPPGPLGECCEQVDKLDVTVVTLKDLPADIPGLKVSANLPLINGRNNAYVIGHPRGSGLQISVHDSLLLASDEQRRLLHYRTPTDPGSSGSPVFNDQWKVIAVHHGGSDIMPMLRPALGVYEANEGVTLAAIRKGLDGAAARP